MTVPVLPEPTEKFTIYERLLRRWQGSINLVSAATLPKLRERHFADSLRLSPFIPQDAAVFDLGSGAGFPGLVLAMARPDLKMTLIESDTKKCTFLSTVSRETQTPVTILNQRVESVSRETIPAIITARAFAPLDKLLGYCLPWAPANPALEILLLKGGRAAEEIAAAGAAYRFDAEFLDKGQGEEGCVLRIKNLALLSGA